MIRLLIVALFVVQIGLIAVAASRIWEAPLLPNDPNDVAKVADVVPSSDGSLESGLPMAHAQALRWDDDAELVLVSQQIDWPFEPIDMGNSSISTGGWLTYVFADGSDGSDGSDGAMSVEIERLNGEVVRTVETIWTDQSVQLPMETVAITSEDAITAVEEIVGRDFRAQCPEVRNRTTVTLTRPRTHGTPAVAPATPATSATPMSGLATPPSATGLIWLVTYADFGAQDHVALIAAVDADNGDIVRIENALDSDTTPCGR